MPHENVPSIVFKNQLGVYANPKKTYRELPQGDDQVTNPDTGRVFRRGERVSATIHHCVQRDGDGLFTRSVVQVTGVIARISPSTELCYIHEEGETGTCIGMAHPDELFQADPKQHRSIF